MTENPKKRKKAIPIVWAIFGFLAAVSAATLCLFVVILGFTGQIWEDTLEATSMNLCFVSKDGQTCIYTLGSPKWIAYFALVNLIIQLMLANSAGKIIYRELTEPD